MTTWQIILAIIIVALSIIMPIYYSHQRKKEAKKESEAIERMQIREYGKKINDETRSKHIDKK
jgi:uncharacterized protein YpmB|tara:strand:+ start:631 stop:819 length:189 start_codon:yes stop_codon:yes gene_type:complete